MTTSTELSSHREVFIGGMKNLCLTQLLSNDDGTICRHGGASFSKNYSYAIVACTGPTPPTIMIFDVVVSYKYRPFLLNY